MAEFVFDLASKLTEKLGSLAYDEISSAWGVKSDLQKLEATMSIIKGVLLDAEEKQEDNQEVGSWLLQLKHLFRDTEDVLDEVECEALRRQVVENFHGTSRKVRRFFSSSNPIAFRLRISHEIKNIRVRIEELEANRARFDRLTDRRANYEFNNVNNVIKRENRTHSYVRASEVIGRDSDKQVIADLLMQDGDDQSGTLNDTLSVIPIVGIGGLGKTTLAKLVYNDERVVRHFELKMWVYVSVDFDSQRLMENTLSDALDKEISEKLSLERLQAKLREALEGKKFLLVLDDVWNEDCMKWRELRDLLIVGAKLGSKILVTTRNHSVAEIMGTAPPYNLDRLSYDHCVSLFTKCAFKEGDEKQHSHLFEIGKEIVKKCGGAPLAVKTLGSQLYSKTDEREWKLVRDSQIWELEREGRGHILPALRLSYSQLPSYLKPCLAYCSYLAKGEYRFNSRELIMCWMAHGILQSRDNENLEMEDVGEQYFKELWARSFFENVQFDGDDYDCSYEFSMHDLIYELVQSIEQGDCEQLDLVNQHYQGIALRLEKLVIDGLPRITDLPEWLQGAANTLQYLHIGHCSNLGSLPGWLTDLTSLRKLVLNQCPKLLSLPEGMDRLTALKELKIKDCTELERRCKNSTGEDWLKIAHITNRSIFNSEDDTDSEMEQ